MTLITTAPLPAPSRLVGLLGRAATEDWILAGPWLRAGDSPIWFSRAAWALEAVAASWSAHHGRPATLWFPDYFCNQSTWPVRRGGARLQFYPITPNLGPDWETCERLAALAPPDFFVQVHYFGFAADMSEARRFCDSNDALLIEDAAHVMAPAGDIGRWGDMVIHSPYKHLPVPDAGLLVMRPSMPSSVRPTQASLPGAAPSPAAWIAKRLVQVALSRVIRRPLARPRRGFADDPATVPLPPTPSLSAAGRRLLAATLPDLPALAERKRRNERAVRRALAAAPGLAPLNSEPGETTVPYRAVFRADDPECAARWYEILCRARVPVETWPDLPPEIFAEPDRHAAALELRSCILLLANNASATPHQLERIYGDTVASAASAIAARRARA